jgi:hypothetical protein
LAVVFVEFAAVCSALVIGPQSPINVAIAAKPEITRVKKAREDPANNP